MDELVQQAKKGDKQAFTQIIISLETDLYKIAKMRLDSNDDIEEAVQETMIEAFKHMKKLKENSYFKTWIIRILINKCNFIYKKNKKNNISFENIKLDNYYSSTNCESVDSKIEFDLLIKKLNYNERIVIILYYLEDLTCKEISSILKIPISTVKNRISRTRIKLRNLLEEEKYERT